jgi:hypothetical protein
VFNLGHDQIPFQSVASKRNIVTYISGGRLTWAKNIGQWLADRSCRPRDLQLLHCEHPVECCICCNFARNQLQPLVEPHPSQT